MQAHTRSLAQHERRRRPDNLPQALRCAVGPHHDPSGVGGWTHVALQVDDIDAAYAALSTAGVAFHLTPTRFPEDAPWFRIAFFRDPDGNEVELFQPFGGRYPQSHVSNDGRWRRPICTDATPPRQPLTDEKAEDWLYAKASDWTAQDQERSAAGHQPRGDR